ncbi:GNAT family N-acetyltransferase [Lapidilactobacillus bayanensis]|uniref:GNAT family N-acetyltransferase n=1 Tax=Lapidilactobacillus bayanensis TaxID=2485998 RepID=UPI000F782365|nr:GNAT family protein [Lapidilactobacillus bayanensis]
MFSYQVDAEIKLALPRLKDAETIFAMIQKDADYLSEWLPWVDSMKSAEEERQFIETSLEHFGLGQSLNLCIWYHDQYAGNISFNKFDQRTRSADIGYLLGQDFQHRGIMHRCVTALLKIGFTEYDLEKIVLKAAVGNRPSNQVIQHAGFHFDGVERHAEQIHDQWLDLNVYSMLRSEWHVQ